MKSFSCTCGNTTFFENTQCVACGHELGWCPACRNIVPLQPSPDGTFQCGFSECGAVLRKCHNYAVEQVCNRCIIANGGGGELCDCCRFNETIPDLSVPGNRAMWHRLESATRRLLYTLDILNLPYGTEEDGVSPPLVFDFKADLAAQKRWWWQMGKEERVYTGHADGRITINIREADPVEREKSRQHFEEAHRTIIGHFRHEIAHYYWQMLVEKQCEDAFVAVFGNHADPTYAQAQERYYRDGPLPDWNRRCVSAYASMHPWEDFAETFATYLDIVSVLHTARSMDLSDECDPLNAELTVMVTSYAKLGVVLNEMNRAMGLVDLVPEILVPPVVAKLQFIHDLVRSAGQNGPLPDGKNA